MTLFILFVCNLFGGIVGTLHFFNRKISVLFTTYSVIILFLVVTVFFFPDWLTKIESMTIKTGFIAGIIATVLLRFTSYLPHSEG